MGQVSEYDLEDKKRCDVCGYLCSGRIYDARIKNTSIWAWLCEACFFEKAKGLGTGLGQQYDKIDGKWQKVAG